MTKLKLIFGSKKDFPVSYVYKNIISILFVFLSMLSVYAEQVEIKGNVLEAASKQPIIGATLKIKGQTVGTVTDFKGTFTIKVNELPINLIVSSIGFKTTELLVSNSSFITISLREDVKSLGEVVVTALGIKRDRNLLPYATQNISSDDLNRTSSSNFVNNLSGKVAGLQLTSSNALGGTNNVIIRGFKSLTQSNQVLFVVDGVPVDNSNQNRNGIDFGSTISDINSEDIESVNVLKGAAASALYGSRAVNGVIVVNTKKGSAKKGKLDVVVSQGIKTGVADKSTLPEYQTQYGQGKGSAGYSATYPDQTGWFYYRPTFNSANLPVNIVITNQDLAWGPAYDPNISVYNWDAFVPGNANYGKATPWTAARYNQASDYFENSLSSNTALNISGSGEESTFKIGYSNNYDKGITPNSSLQKNVFNFGWSYDLTKKLKIGTSLNYSNTAAINRNTYDYRAANTNVRDLRQWNPSNIDYKALRSDYNNGLNASWNILTGSYNVVSEKGIKAAYHNNPYWNDYENYNNDTRNRYFGNVYATFEIVKGLEATARISRDSYSQFFENRVAVDSYQTSLYARTNLDYAENNLDFLLNYEAKISELFDVKALFGSNIRRNTTSSISTSTSGGLAVPGLYSISNSVSVPAAPQEYIGTKQVNGVFGGFTLSYDELLSLDVTGRWDQSSALPVQNNSYFYPAVSGSFNFKKLVDANWLNFGKLRVNYAEVGSDAPIYSNKNTYVAGTPFNGVNIFSNPTTNSNVNLKPERSTNYELGFEASLLKNRINIDMTYYHSRLNNQITPITPSTATGYSNYFVNGGTIQNQGVELSLNFVPVRTQDFSYDATVNWSKNNNKVISLYGGQPSYTIAQYHNSVQLVAEVGQPYGILRGSDYEYLNGERLVDNNGYYVKSSNKNSNLGKISPDWIGSINNRFKYKSVELNILIDASKGGNVYSLDNDNGSRSGILVETAANNDLGNPLRNTLANGGGVVLPGVKADGTPNDKRIDVSDAQLLGNKIPFGSTNGLTAKSYVYDASYVKIRELALSYRLPEKLFGNDKLLHGVTLSLSARNLWIIYKNLPYSDPEQGAPSTTLTNADPLVYNSNASIGYQNAVLPSVKEIAFNVKLNF